MKTYSGKQNVALVFDWLDDHGGMEQVNLALAETFPDAPIYTSVYDEQKFPQLKGRVKTSWLQKFPRKIRPKHQLLGPLMPFAFKSFNLKAYDLIISSASSGFAKSVRKTRAGQTHICYCHTPIRYLYHAEKEYLHDYPLPWWLQIFRGILPLVLKFLRWIDQRDIRSVDHFIANSQYVAKRIKKYYQKDAAVIYPGNDLAAYLKQKHLIRRDQDKPRENSERAYFLALGRFIPYKRFDLLVDTFLENGFPLKLAGTGPELDRLKQKVRKQSARALQSLGDGGENIEFLGFVPTEKLPELYAKARAFLFPAEEDFGLTPVEAMAAGTPVIYYAKGGAVESVGEQGIRFAAQTVASLQSAIDRFEAAPQKFSAENLQAHARKFDKPVFQQKILDFIKNLS